MLIDIAVDGMLNPNALFPETDTFELGWALTLLSQQNISYASTAQTIGLNCGYFLSFTVFLALNSADFAYVAPLKEATSTDL